MSEYPKGRGAFFCCKYTRLLMKTVAAKEIGPTGCWLLAIIVQTEDAGHYRRGVLFHDFDLIELLGIGRRTLTTIRNACIGAGFLHYEPGRRLSNGWTAGKYWVVVHPTMTGLDDSPSDEWEHSEDQEKAPPEEPTHKQSLAQKLPRTARAVRSKDIPVPVPTSKVHLSETYAPAVRDVLKNMKTDELTDFERLIARWGELVALDPEFGGEPGRLDFCALAAKAHRKGAANPCGLFRTLVRLGRKQRIEPEFEEIARLGLKAHLYGWKPPRVDPHYDPDYDTTPPQTLGAILAERGLSNVG